jgi:hypothetical protein
MYFKNLDLKSIFYVVKALRTIGDLVKHCATISYNFSSVEYLTCYICVDRIHDI